MAQMTLDRYGFAPMRIQVGNMPGPEPRRGPTLATGSSDVTGTSRVTTSNATGTHHQLILAQWNAEGIRHKKTELQNFLRQYNIDVCCIQETHLTNNIRFTVRGYESHRQDRLNRTKGGIVTLVKNNIASAVIYESKTEDTESLGVKILHNQEQFTIYNVYSPPDKPILLESLVPTDHCWMLLGDLNSHSPSWGYADLDKKGEDVENWMLINAVDLINKPDDPPTFYSRRWRTTSTPDLAIATDDVASNCTREVCPQLGGSDHRPMIIRLSKEMKGPKQSLRPSWNYKKANWQLFTQTADDLCEKIVLSESSITRNARFFNEAILAAAKKAIPRGRRAEYKPFWNKDLHDLHEKVCVTRDAMETDPSDSNVILHNQAKAVYTRAKIDSIRKSWHEKTESLNLEKDSRQLWNLTKCLNEERPSQSKTVLECDGKLSAGRDAANTLAEVYRQRSTLQMPKQRTAEIRMETKQLKEHPIAEEECMTADLTLSELEVAIKIIKPKKAPGPDGIGGDMLKHLGAAAKQTLLSIFNQSWKTGTVPTMWKLAHIIPILKKGKNKLLPNSYRPISLLSCIGKLLERIINKRLLWYLESHHLLSPTQTGYRKNRSTEDQLSLLAQEMENGFQEKKKTLAVFFDLTQAFDRVWKDGLLLKLLRAGVRSRLFCWIKNFLIHRTARVLVDGVASHRVNLREGVPQGAVISPALFLVFINDITDCIPRHVSNTLHADDFAVWSTATYTTTAVRRVQDAVCQVDKWMQDWGQEASKTKTCATLFSLSTKKEEVVIKLGTENIPIEETPTFIGVKHDTRLTWKQHIDTVKARAIKRLALMRKLSGSYWGANSRILRQVYVGSVRPVMEYASASWATAAKTNKAELDKIQNMGLRTILGALKTTPVAEMEKTADIEPLESRRNLKILTQCEKTRRLPSHPLHGTLLAGTHNRLKRKSQFHLAKKLQQPLENFIPRYDNEAETENLEPECWLRMEPAIEIRQSIPGIIKKEDQTPSVQQALALELIDNEYPRDHWIHAYTDGSAIDAVRSGGSGAYIRYPDGTTTALSKPTGDICTNFKAEIIAIQMTVDHLIQTRLRCKNVVILTDSLSTALALDSKNNNCSLTNLKSSLCQLTQNKKVIIQWIPAHCGIPGNDRADALAKQGGQQPQQRTTTSYDEAKMLLKQAHRKTWQKKKDDKSYDTLLRLSRWEATTIFRLRTGHCRLQSHLARMNLTASPMCDCQETDETPEHILQDCPRWEPQRQQIWPDGATLDTKLWGSREELQQTCRFIKDIGLVV